MTSKPPSNGPRIILVVALVGVGAAIIGGGHPSTPPAQPEQQVAPPPAAATVPAPPSPVPERPKLPDLTAAEQRETIALVRTKWRAENGETIDQILANAAKVAHFYLRGKWEADRWFDGLPSAGISFVTNKAAKDGDAYSISWIVQADGTFTVEPSGFRAIELGSKAFALALIDNEVVGEVKAPNMRYLLDAKNLDWLKTDAGPLSELLIRARCTLVEILHPAEFRRATDPMNKTRRDEWTFQTATKCTSGPVYCADGGSLIFQRADRETWKPVSTCARLLVGLEPLDHLRPFVQEQVRPPGTRR